MIRLVLFLVGIGLGIVALFAWEWHREDESLPNVVGDWAEAGW